MYTRKRGFIVVLGAALSGLSLFLLLAAQPVAAASDAGGLCQSDVTADTPTEPAAEIVTAPNCRYGVSASKADYMGDLNAGWAVTFAPTAAWLPAGVDHAATIGSSKSRMEPHVYKSITTYTRIDRGRRSAR